MIDECRREYGAQTGATFAVGAMQNLPYPDGSFDVVLCMGALEYLSPAAEVQAITEMARILRDGGLLIICCLNALSLYWAADHSYNRLCSAVARFWLAMRARLFGPSGSYPAIRPAVPFRTFRRAACLGLLQRSGFDTIETRFFAMSPLPSMVERRLPRLALRLSRTLESHPTNPQWPLAKGFILAAQKQPVRQANSRFTGAMLALALDRFTPLPASLRGCQARAPGSAGQNPIHTRGSP
jgi:SAM-dependent methyltransferase